MLCIDKILFKSSLTFEVIVSPSVMLSMLDETIGSPVDVDQLIATFGSAAVALQKAVN